MRVEFLVIKQHFNKVIFVGPKFNRGNIPAEEKKRQKKKNLVGIWTSVNEE